MRRLILGSEGMGIWGSCVINRLITMLYPDIEIINKNDNSCNIIMKSDFVGDENRWNNIKKKYIYWSGEPWAPERSEFETKSLYILTTYMNPNDVINHPNFLYIPFALYSPFVYKKRFNNSIDRKYLVAYCSSHKVEMREDLFNLFVEKTGTELCHSLGKNHGKYPSSQRKVDGGGMI